MQTPSLPPSSNTIFLYDGICALCNGMVKFTIRHDKKSIFQFASLQSESGQNLLGQFNLDPTSLRSMILIHENRVYDKSSAALKTIALLGWPWKYMSILLYIPPSIPDFFYSLIAKYRYRIFGKLKSCPLPSAEHAGRFL